MFKHASGEIWNGDCLELMRNIPDGSIDMVVTSPPYDNMRTYGGSLEWTFEIFQSIAKELSRVIKDGGVIVWNVMDATIKGSETGTSFRQALYFKDECGLHLRDTMIWLKPDPMPNGDQSYYQNSFEYMFVFTKGKITTTNIIRIQTKTFGAKKTKGDTHKDGWKSTGEERHVKETKRKTNVWEIAKSQNNSKHPAVFPVQLAQDHILSWSNEGETVLDPFGGSGTTAVAAHRTGRRSICIERDLGYYLGSCGRIWKEQQA